MSRKKNKNQQIMHKDDQNDCIRYLMKEMDPSEELLMERAMMEDDDLLIEVESLRQTLRRLDNLPKKNPPKDLTESIVAKAARHKENEKSRFTLFSFEPLKYVAAASVMIATALGSFWLMQDNSATPNQPTNQIESTSASTVTNSILSNTFRTSPVNLENDDTDPWIDKDNMLRFEDRQNQATADFESIFQNSFEKLKPLNEPFSEGTNPQSIYMTGSNQ